MTQGFRNSQFASDLLAMAHQDLKAARHLYTGEFYPQAVFYLEQSAEKGLKSYSIAFGIINETDAWREISHKTLKIYEKTARDLKKRVVAEEQKLKDHPVLEAALQAHVDLPLMIEKFDESLDELKEQSQLDDKSLCLTEEELNDAIKTLRAAHRDANHERATIHSKKTTPSEFRKVKRRLTKILEAALVGQPERLRLTKEELNHTFTFESYENMMKKILSKMISPMEAFQSFFQLSIILQPHAVARYPKTGFNPLELYTPDLPLIKSFTKLAEITEWTLNQVDEIYQNTERISS